MQKVCVNCKCVNNDDDFDYNKLNERCKTRIKCGQQRLKKEVNDTQQCCARCYTVKPNQNIEYIYHTFIDGTQLYTPHKTCNTCRDRDTRRGWDEYV